MTRLLINQIIAPIITSIGILFKYIYFKKQICVCQELGLPSAHVPLSQDQYTVLVNEIVRIIIEKLNTELDRINELFYARLLTLKESIDREISEILGQSKLSNDELSSVNSAIARIEAIVSRDLANGLIDELNVHIAHLFERDESVVKIGRFPAVVAAVTELFQTQLRSSISFALGDLEKFYEDLKQPSNWDTYFFFDRASAGNSVTHNPDGEQEKSLSNKITTIINASFLSRFNPLSSVEAVLLVVKRALRDDTRETTYRERQIVKKALRLADRAVEVLEDAHFKGREAADELVREY